MSEILFGENIPEELSLTDSDIGDPQYADPFLISPLSLAAEKIINDPPNLIDFAQRKDSNEMKTIATNLHKLLSTPGNIMFSEESRKDIEKSICAFIYELLQNEQMSGSNNDSNLNISDLSNAEEYLKMANDKLSESKSTQDFLSKKLLIAEGAKKQLELSVKDLQDEIELLYTEKAKETQEALKLKKLSDDEKQNLQNKNDALQEEVKKLKDSIVINEKSRTRLKNFLDSVNEENSNLKTEIFNLQNKLKEKQTNENTLKSNKISIDLQIQKLETENQQLTVSLNEFKTKYELAQKELSNSKPENIEKIEKDKRLIQESLTSLLKQIENQSEEIVLLNQNSHEYLQLLQRAMQCINYFDVENNSNQTDKDRLITLNQNLENQLDSAKNELKKYIKYSQFFNSLKESLPKDLELEINLTDENADEEVFLQIQNIISNKQIISDEKADRLYLLLENQIRFLSNLVSTNQIDLFLLTNRTQTDSIKDSSGIKEQILMELARVRQFIQENKLSSKQEFFVYPNQDQINKEEAALENANDSILMDALSKNREICDTISTIILQSRVVQDYCSKLKIQSALNMNVIQEIINTLQYEGEISDLADCIADDLSSLNGIIDDIKTLTGIDDNNSLKKYIKNVMTVNMKFDTAIREQVGFEGDIRSLPDFLHSYIDKLQSNNQKHSEMEIETCHSQIENLTEEIEKSEMSIRDLKSEVDNRASKCKQLSDELTIATKEKDALKNEVEEMKKKQSETLNRFKIALQNIKELESSNNRLSDENKRLLENINQKDENLNKRLSSLLKEESQQHKEELESMKSHYLGREEKFVEIIKKLKNKYKLSKDKLKEVMAAYDEAFKKQKDTVIAIKVRNDTLTKELAKERNKDNHDNKHLSSENLRLQTLNKSLLFEKSCLESKVNQLTAKCDQIQVARDNYWNSQIGMKEVEFKKKETILIQSQNTFIQELVTKMGPYSPKPIDTSYDYVKTAVSFMIKKIKDDESMINRLQTELIKRSQSEEGSAEPSHSSAEEWEKWGRDIYSNVTDGDISHHSPKDLRYVLGEMIIASISQRKLIRKLESLRIQKKLLKHVPINVKPKGPVSLKNLIVVIMVSRKLISNNVVSVAMLNQSPRSK